MSCRFRCQDCDRSWPAVLEKRQHCATSKLGPDSRNVLHALCQQTETPAPLPGWKMRELKSRRSMRAANDPAAVTATRYHTIRSLGNRPTEAPLLLTAR